MAKAHGGGWTAESIVPLAVFAVLLAHGLLTGPTDDEAYYWALAQHPALGFAYHPPMAVWCIAVIERLCFGLASPLFSVRLPSALLGAAVAYLGLRWVREAGGSARRPWATALTVVALPGVFALAWMMVPDLPLFLGWTLAFYGTWRVLLEEDAFPRAGTYARAALAGGIAIALAAKFSGVLVAASAIVALMWSGRREARRAIFWAVGGALLGLLPTILWNIAHDWSPLLYQIRDRHAGGGALSWARWGRFWAIQAVAVGPVLLVYAFGVLREAVRDYRDPRSPARYLAIWMVPAAVYLVQPLTADFKPHWAFIFFWPAVLGMALRVDTSSRAHWFALQRGWAAVLSVMVLIVCHFPIITALTGNPLLDVGNDLYGWRLLPNQLKARKLDGLPVIGSWYQTASQAAFALAGTGTPVTLLPRDIKSRDDWRDPPGLVESPGPDWPRLQRPALYVMDQRYSAPPSFPGTRCALAFDYKEARFALPAKQIGVWRCEPDASPPGSS